MELGMKIQYAELAGKASATLLGANGKKCLGMRVPNKNVPPSKSAMIMLDYRLVPAKKRCPQKISLRQKKG